MRTFLYNLDTQERIGEIRNGPYLVDGLPGPLPSNIVEITIVEEPLPAFDYDTEKTVRTDVLDLNRKELRITFEVVQLTPEEIEARKPQWNECTPLQLRMAMIDYNIDPDMISTMIAGMQDPVEQKKAYVAWEYASTIKKDHYLVQFFATALNLDSSTVDSIFEYANTIE